MTLSGYRPVDIRNPYFGAPVLFTESTGTTMEDAARLIGGNDRRDGIGGSRESAAGDLTGDLAGASGASRSEKGAAGKSPVPGTVLVAGEQTRGVGRMPGRVWYSPPGENLLMSLLLPEATVPFPVTLTPLAAAAGLARFVEEEFELEVRIKWPNDLMISDRKCAGILCRRIRGWLVTGIGLNVLQNRFPEASDRSEGGRATSLVLESGREVPTPLELLPSLLKRLEKCFESENIAREVEELLWRRGCEYTVTLGDPERKETVTGIAEGIDGNGALLLRIGGTVREITSGEVPVAGNRLMREP